MIPDRLGPYRIVRRLGVGGMGEVFEAVHEELNRPVALKLLHRGAVQGDEAQRRFRREMQTAAALIHPHLVRLYDGGALDGTLYMAMELVTGESLAARLGRERPATSWSMRVARQVADGLQFLHAQGILHRDVKPHNILLESDGTAKLADFGLVRTQEGTAITAEGGLVGTLAYMAPEQISGQPATIASDLWGLGCVLYEMLAGRRAFLGNANELFRAIKHDPIAPIEGLPPALESLLARLLDRDPAARPASAAEVAEILAARPSTGTKIPRKSSPSLARPAAAPRSWPVRAREASGPCRVRSAGDDHPPPVLTGARNPHAAWPLALALALLAFPAVWSLRPGASPPAPSASTRPPEGPGGPAWVADVVGRAKALEERDPRQREAVVFDALQELGRADPAIPWPGDLDGVALSVLEKQPGRFIELRARGRNAYEDATLELAADVPRRERVYAAEFKTLVRDLSAMLPCALRRDAPYYLTAHAGVAVDFATAMEYRVFDEKTVLALEQEVLALCAAHTTWRGPFLRSFSRGRNAGAGRLQDRRAALDLFERELETRQITEIDSTIWHELVGVTMQTCELAKDRAAAQELHEHAVARRERYPKSRTTSGQWRAAEKMYRKLVK